MSAGTATAAAPGTGSWLGLYFDDIERGATLRTRCRTIGAADMQAFAWLTGDRLALDAHPCRRRRGQAGPYATLVLSYALGLLPVDPRCVIAVRELRDVQFHAELAPGMTLHVDGVVEALTPVDAATGIVHTRIAVVTDAGRELATGVVGALWRRGEPA
jgi:acyl dehydratase